MDTIIVVDSCCDLPLSYVTDHSEFMDVIGMPVCIDGKDYTDDLGMTLSHDFLYEQLERGVMPATAQVNAFQFEQMFKKHVKDRKTVIYIGLSCNLSGTNNNAKMAIEAVKSSYPEADIKVLASKSASIGQGILAMKAVEMVKQGIEGDEIFSWLEANELYSNHWFAVDDLTFLKNGGRITPAQAAVGTLLNVKPILVVDQEGVLKPYGKVKGRKKSINFLVEKFKAHYDGARFDKILVGHGHALEDAIQLKSKLSQYVDEDRIIISELSATIASHVGPGMLAIGFLGNKREI